MQKLILSAAVLFCSTSFAIAPVQLNWSSVYIDVNCLSAKSDATESLTRECAKLGLELKSISITACYKSAQGDYYELYTAEGFGICDDSETLLTRVASAAEVN